MKISSNDYNNVKTSQFQRILAEQKDNFTE